MTGIVDFLTQPGKDPAEAVNGQLVSTLGGLISEIPPVPSRINQLGLFIEQGMLGTKLFFDRQGYEIRLVQSTERGAAVPDGLSPSRNNVHLKAVRLSEKATILADDFRDILALGTSGGFESLNSWMTQRLWSPTQSVRATNEWHKLGAIKGEVLDANGDVIFDLYDLFGFTKPEPVELELDTASTDVRGKMTKAKRAMMKALGGVPATGFHAFAGDNLWDKLVGHKSVRETWLNTQRASELRDNAAYESINLGGITIENYHGYVGETPFVGPDEIRFFPVGVPGLFQQHFAPADRFPFNDGMGLKEYVMPYRKDDGTAIDFIVQSNPVTLCTRPNALLSGVTNTAPSEPEGGET